MDKPAGGMSQLHGKFRRHLEGRETGLELQLSGCGSLTHNPTLLNDTIVYRVTQLQEIEKSTKGFIKCCCCSCARARWRCAPGYHVFGATSLAHAGLSLLPGAWSLQWYSCFLSCWGRCGPSCCCCCCSETRQARSCCSCLCSRSACRCSSICFRLYSCRGREQRERVQQSFMWSQPGRQTTVRRSKMAH